MDTYSKNIRPQQVDDIDEEVYYREMLGCTATMESPGTCATLNCGKGEFRVCQKPGPGAEGRVAQEGCGSWCEDAC